MRRRLRPFASLLAPLVFAVAVYATTPPPIEGGFSLVVVPDTQNYTWQRPELYALQAGWIAANVSRYNIAHVLHVGDITQHNNKQEWEAARRAHALYADLVPTAFTAGNHDLGPDGTTQTRASLFTDYITLVNYRRHPGFGGVYDREPDRTENSYHLVTAGGRDWLILALEFGPRDDVVRWANEVVARYPARSAILVTHAYLFSDGTRYEGTKQEYAPAAFGVARLPGGVNDGESLWRGLVRKHANFAMVISGHVGITAHLESTGEHGNIVHQLVVDYQNVENGGNGWLRLLQFHADGQTVTVRDYSPLLNETTERETFVVPRTGH